MPAVCVGDRCVSGVQLDGVAELLGIAHEQGAQLPPAELVAKLDLVLAAAQRFLRQAPLEQLDYRSPDRDRSFRNLGYHTFQVARTFVVAAETGSLPARMIAEPAPDQAWSGDQLAAYGDEVRELARRWWDGGEHDFDRSTETYYGTHPLHDVLERSTWHAAQHARQLMMFLERLDIDPDGPLTERDLAGLPLPEGVWD